MGFFDFFTSIFSGGATGLLGIAIQRFADFKNKQLDIDSLMDKMEHERHMKQIDAEIMREEWAQRTEIARTEAYSREEVADSNTFAASFAEPVRYSQDVRKYSKGQAWALLALDILRGIVRPGLTVYLCVLTTLIYFSAERVMSHGITPEKAAMILEHIVNSILYMATTCLLWWFGTRNKQPAPKLK